jgi:hypothetical protein
VQQVHVEVITAQALEAPVTRTPDLLGPETATTPAVQRAGGGLGADEEGVGDLAQRGPDDRLVAGVEVVLGRVDPVRTGRRSRIKHLRGPAELGRVTDIVAQPGTPQPDGREHEV